MVIFALMYVFKLAFKNVISRKSSVVIIIFIAFAISLLVLSNAIMDGTDNGIENTYVNSFTGDIVIRPEAEFPLSLFGDETPVTGVLSAIPGLVPYTSTKDIVLSDDDISSTISQISGAAAVNLNNVRTTIALFGVEAQDYFEMMTAVDVVEGSAFEKGQNGIMLNEILLAQIEKNSSTEIHVGDSLQLISSDGSSFSIRSVPLTGIYRYKVANDLLEKIAIVDPATLRDLMGMTDTFADDSSISTDQKDLLESDFDLDDLFSEDSDFFGDTDGDFTGDFSDELNSDFAYYGDDLSVSNEEADAVFDDTATDGIFEPFDGAVPEERVLQESTAWNFIICKTAPGAKTKNVIRQLNSQFKKNGIPVQAVDWRAAAGSSVSLINYMRIILNIGIILILLTGFIVVDNSLIVSSLSRIQETGTLRAIGAKRAFIAVQFLIETALLAVTAGIIGCFTGWIFNQILSSFNITISNKYLMQLFGGSTLKTVVTASNILGSLGLSVVLAVVGWFYPVKVALETNPVAAMRGQS